jgi:hypothetical protein
MDQQSKSTGVLIYDVHTVPDGMDLEKIVYIWKEHGFILWDSRDGGQEPKVLDPMKVKGIVVDISTTDKEQLSVIQKLIDNE